MAYNLIGQHTIERDGRQIRLYGDGVSVSDPMNFVVSDINQVAGKRTSQLINWRMPHKLEVPVIDNNGTYADLIRDESPTKFKVELDDPDGNLIYKGYVSTKLQDYQFHQDVINWTLKTYDGVTVLKKEPIGTDFSSAMTMGEAFRVLMNKVGHNMDTRILTDLEHVDTGSGTRPELIRGVWQEMVADVDDPSYYKLLERMLQYFKYRLVQSDGFWYIQQRNLINNSSWLLYHYPADTTSSSYTVTDDDHIIDIPHDPRGTSYLKRSNEQTVPGILTYRRAQSISHPPFNTVNGRFNEGDFTGWRANASIYSENKSIWDYTGNDKEYSAIGDDNMSLDQTVIKPIKEGDTFSLTMRNRFYIDKSGLSNGTEYNIPLGNVRLVNKEGAMVRYLQLSERDGGNLRYKWAQPDEQWELQYNSTDDKWEWTLIGNPPSNYRGISFRFKPENVSSSVSSDPTISQYEIEVPENIAAYDVVFVELSYDPYSDGKVKNNPVTGTYFQLFHFYVSPENISDTSIEVAYIGRTDNLGDGQELDESYIYGDRLSRKVTTDMEYYRYTGEWVPTVQWDTDGNNIHQHIIHRVGGQGTRPNKAIHLSLSYLGNYRPKIHECVRFDSFEYEVQQVRHSVANKRYEIYLVEISQNIIAALNEALGDYGSGQETINSAAQSSKEATIHIEDRLENFFGNDAVTTTTDVVGYLVNSIPIQSIGADIVKADDYIYVIGRYARPVEFVVKYDVGANDSFIIVDEKAIQEPLPSGSKVLYTGKRLKTAITQNANAIALKAPKILLDTDIFRDADWNGEIDSNGNITKFASEQSSSNPSYAITGKGHFEFTNGETYWRYNGGDIDSILGGGSKISNPGGDWSLSKSGLDLALSGGKFDNPERRVSWGSDSFITSIGGTLAYMYVHHRDRIRIESTISDTDQLRSYAFISRTAAQIWAEDDSVPQQRGFEVYPDEFRFQFNTNGDIMNIQSVGDSGGAEAGWVKVTIKGTTMYLRAFSTK